MSSVSDREFLALRAQLRELLLSSGTPLAPDAETTEQIDEVIGHLVARRTPKLHDDVRALMVRIADAAIAADVDQQTGSIMAAYGRAGYFAGLSAGLELAALTFTGALGPVPAKGHVR